MRRVLILTTLLCALFASVALAKTKHGITPLSPKKGQTVPLGSVLKFKGKFSGPGQIYVYVSTSRKTNKKGVIGFKAYIDRAHKKKNGHFETSKTPNYTFPSWFLNKAGTYYWQAHRIECTSNTSDCLQEGPIVKFKVG